MDRGGIHRLGLVLCLLILGPSQGETRTPAPTQAGGETVFHNFEGDVASKPPTNFRLVRTGRGSDGIWVVMRDPTAPSKPNVLAQTSTDRTDYRFPLAILDEGSYQNVDVSVKFKAVSGSVDQAGGVVFRYQDANNYYVVRANALEDNYRLYRVVGGRRQQFAGANFRVTPNQWHMLRVEAVGDQIRCYYDGELKITASEETFKEPGKVGLWTKADSVTYFDDFTVSLK